MILYAELTFSGKLRRLRKLAIEGLARYELKNPQISYHGFFTNLLYRVDTATGERLMLRLASPGWRTYQDLRSEAMWLEALHRETSVNSPVVVPARTGELVLPLSSPGVSYVRNATLMSRMPGRLLRFHLNDHNLEKMGALFAELHYHGKSWVPPESFTSRRFEHWLSRGEANLIVRDNRSPEGSSESVELPSQLRRMLERMNMLVEKAYAQVDRSDLRVIHCDLWHDNIKLYRGELHPFDFEDTVWGFRAHDIAMAMLDLLETVGDDLYPALLSAFRRGYEAHMAWPEDPIEPFQIGRLLWKINWVAKRQPESVSSTAESHIPVFEYFERTSKVLRPPQINW